MFHLELAESVRDSIESAVAGVEWWLPVNERFAGVKFDQVPLKVPLGFEPGCFQGADGLHLLGGGATLLLLKTASSTRRDILETLFWSRDLPPSSSDFEFRIEF